MNPFSWVVLAIIAVATGGAIHYIRHHKGCGGCCGDCSACRKHCEERQNTLRKP